MTKFLGTRNTFKISLDNLNQNELLQNHYTLSSLTERKVRSISNDIYIKAIMEFSNFIEKT